MINEPLYKKSTSKLFDAYFKDTLVHGDCDACAVGTLLNTARWFALFGTSSLSADVGQTVLYTNGHKFSKLNTYALQNVKLLHVVESYGYKWQELARIEWAFESAPKGSSKEDYMFNGLAAVLDVLAQIHETDQPTAAESLQPFKSHYALKSA